jgi:selenide, water dikinase
MGPDALAHVLRPLTGLFGDVAPDLLVGLGMADDAAVYRLNAEQAIVATTDFFPPVVDDPYAFGAVAAANALSDIYAMGGDPLFCLNLVGFPDDLDAAILTEILRGGAEKVREAGAVIAGGHTVTDKEPKYGLAAIGLVHPDRIFTKGGAHPGDIVLLTKPLGTGVLTTAHKNEDVRPDDLAAAITSMTTLNGAASRALRTLGSALHACTDVTGFGLLGHALEMATQSNAAMRFELAAIPFLPGTRQYAKAGYTPGGTQRNATHLAPHVTYGPTIGDVDRLLLNDPQTSGGLLAAMDPAALDATRAALESAGVPYWIIGSVAAGAGIVVE